MSNNSISKNKSKRIFYFDALRALAIICVILVHTVTLYKFLIFNAWTGPTLSWTISQIIYNPVRIGVLLFLMLSGALSLGRKWDVRSFLGKRIPRIVYPFVFWNAIFISIYIVLSYFGIIHVVKAFDVQYLAEFIWGALNGDVYGFNPNWFFWMILGTYLIMPIFNRWLYQCSLREVEYFLVFWLVTCLFTYTLKVDFPVALKYFTCPIGLVIAGYYLRHTDREILNNPYYALILLIILTSVSTYIGYLRSSPTNLSCFNRYSIFNVLIAMCVFIIFKNFSKFNLKPHIYSLNKLLRRFVSALAKYSYGIYLIHYPIIFLVYHFLPVRSMHYGVLVSLSVLVGIFVSMGILAMLNRIPYIRDIIGAK